MIFLIFPPSPSQVASGRSRLCRPSATSKPFRRRTMKIHTKRDTHENAKMKMQTRKCHHENRATCVFPSLSPLRFVRNLWLWVLFVGRRGHAHRGLQRPPPRDRAGRSTYASLFIIMMCAATCARVRRHARRERVSGGGRHPAPGRRRHLRHHRQARSHQRAFQACVRNERKTSRGGAMSRLVSDS